MILNFIMHAGEFSYVYKAHYLKPKVIAQPAASDSEWPSMTLSQSFQPSTVAVKTLKGKFCSYLVNLTTYGTI